MIGPMKKQSGFTLLELMITISVAAVLISIGVPGMQDFMRNNRRAAEVNNLVAALQIARSEAVAQNRRVEICASANLTSCAGSTSWETGWIVHVDADGDNVVDADEILRAESGPDAMTLRAAFQRLQYRPNGRIQTFDAAGTSGDFTFCDARGAGKARVVQLDISGRPSISTERLDGSAVTCP